MVWATSGRGLRLIAVRSDIEERKFFAEDFSTCSVA